MKPTDEQLAEILIAGLKKAGITSFEEWAECGRVAAAFPPHRRRWNLGWEAYVACANMPEDEQDLFMDYYAEHGEFPGGMHFGNVKRSFHN